MPWINNNQYRTRTGRIYDKQYRATVTGYADEMDRGIAEDEIFAREQKNNATARDAVKSIWTRLSRSQAANRPVMNAPLTAENLSAKIGAIYTAVMGVNELTNAIQKLRQTDWGNSSLNENTTVDGQTGSFKRFSDYWLSAGNAMLSYLQNLAPTLKSQLENSKSNPQLALEVVKKLPGMTPQGLGYTPNAKPTYDELLAIKKNVQDAISQNATGPTTQDVKARATARQEQIQTKLKGQAQGYVNAPVTQNLQATPNQQTAMKGTLFNTIRSL